MPSVQKSFQRLYQKALPLLYMGLALYLTILLLRYPALSLQYAYTGLTLWFQKMIPTLLPFMILSGIMISMNLTERFVRLLHPILHFFYGTTKNGSYTLLMGFLCGFPMGARIAGELRRAGRISKKEAQCLLAFSNNIGPIYFLSFVVSTLSLKRPLLPFFLMYGVPFLYGIALMRIVPAFSGLIRPRKHLTDLVGLERRGDSKPRKPDAHTREGLLPAIDASVLSGLIGIGKLGGYMVFCNLLNIMFVPFTHLPPFLLHLYQCLLEITSGISGCGGAHPYLVLILLPFGGFSCIAQTYSMIRGTDLSIRPYLFHKLIQTGITALCYFVLRPFP